MERDGSTDTTLAIINSFATAYWIKRFGVKAVMFQQTAGAAMRNLTQIYAQTLGGATGIRVIQTTQLFNNLGSGRGYQLAANSFIALLAEPEKRTSYFGLLSGMAMLGSSTGYTLAFYSSLGASIFGCDCLIVRISWRLGVLFLRPARPVRGHLLLLVFCTVFCTIFLPYLAPEEPVTGPNGKNSKRTVLAPLKIFVPTRQTVDGVTKRDFNLFLLGAGSLFSVLATGYVSMALQLGGTNVFVFQPAKTGGMLVSRTQNNSSWWQADSAPTVAHPPRPRLLLIPLLPAHHHP